MFKVLGRSLGAVWESLGKLKGKAGFLFKSTDPIAAMTAREIAAIGPMAKKEALGVVGESIEAIRSSKTIAEASKKMGVIEISSGKELEPAFGDASEIAWDQLKHLGGVTVLEQGPMVASMEAVWKEVATVYIGTATKRWVKASVSHALGARTHELLEFKLRDLGSQEFFEAYRHLSALVPWGEAASYGALGLSWRRAKKLAAGVESLERQHMKRFLKEGWRAGRKAFYKAPRMNRAVNPIEGFTEQGLAALKRYYGTDFGSPVSRGMEVAKGILESVFGIKTGSELAIKAAEKLEGAESLEAFNKFLGVKSISKPAEAFPIRKFLPGTGRTVIFKSGKAIPMVAKPEAIAKYRSKVAEYLHLDVNDPRIAFDPTNRLHQLQYMSSSFHEKLEQLIREKGSHNELYMELFGHTAPDALELQGRFLQQIGATPREVGKLYPVTDLNRALITKGYTDAAQEAVATRRKMRQVVMSKDPELRPSGLVHRLNAKRRMSHGVRTD